MRERELALDTVGKIEPQPWMVSAATRAVMTALTARGDEARFVGGCVRDAVLGRPVRDIDIATPVSPEAVMALLEEAGLKVVPTGLAHGTVTAVVAPEHYEITTLREDVETDGRHARVAFTDDWMADASRRDFTMNALFMDGGGQIFDPFGGMRDLEDGRVRFVGRAEARIEEDYLRLLRFFRFHAYYGRRAPDHEGLAACTKLAPGLKRLSAERVWAETRRLLLAETAGEVFALMAHEGVTRHFLPEASHIARLQALATLERDHAAANAVRRLAAVAPVDGAGAAALAERLKLSNADRDRLVAIAAELPAFEPAAGKAGRRVLHRLGADLVCDLTLLHWADHEEGARGDHYLAALDEAARWTPKTLPVHGADVLALGVAAGPKVGEILAAVETWWIEGDFKASRKAALEKIQKITSN